MYFLFHNNVRYLNLEGNLIITHNERPIMGNHKRATPQHITGGMFVKVVRTSGFWRRIQATRAALLFIWGESQARNQGSDNAYLAKVKTADKIDGNALAGAGKTMVKKTTAVGPTCTQPDAPIPIDRVARDDSEYAEADPC